MRETQSLNWRVLAAALFSAALVVGTYALAGEIKSPALAEASAETALLQALATKDSNGDGLPDWQKVLYGIPIDSPTTDYFNLGMTDGEAVARGLIVPKAIADLTVETSSDAAVTVDPSLPPVTSETLTDVFAKNFFSLYYAAKQANGGIQLSANQVNDLALQSLDMLASLATVAPDYKSLRDLTVVTSSQETLKTFAADAEAVLLKNLQESGATKREIPYLEDVVQRNDASALPHLAAIAKSYRESAVGLATLPVPAVLAFDMLSLINALMRQSGVVSDFARVNTDPLAAMLALDQHVEVNEAAGKALASIGEKYAATGTSLPAGTPGAQFLGALARYQALVAFNTP